MNLMQRRRELMMMGGGSIYEGWQYNKALDSSGAVIDGEGWAVSDFLPCNNVVRGKRANTTTQRVVTACFYNEDLTFNKSHSASAVDTGNMFGNSGYKYVRYVVKLDDIDDCYLKYVYGTQDYLFKGINVT